MGKAGTLRDYLRHRGLKVTHQREEIAQTFLDSTRHLSAEELYRLIQKVNGNSETALPATSRSLGEDTTIT